jgi:hypothetical protein
MRKGPEPDELPWWLDLDNWPFFNPQSPEFSHFSQNALEALALLRDFVPYYVVP